MGINIDDNIVGMWFIALTEASDFLGGLSRDGDNFVWLFRFRYYKDDKTWNSKDEKSWHEVRIRDRTEAQVIEMVRDINCRMFSLGAIEQWEMLRGTRTPEEFVREWARMPFNHGIELTMEQYEQYERDGTLPGN
jgi:hypothetical protein